MSAERDQRRRNYRARRAVPTPDEIVLYGRAFELRSKGRTYPEIACDMGVSLGTSHNWVTRGMRFYLADRGAESLAAEMDAQLDTATRHVMDKLQAGDLSAVDRLLKIHKRRADLHGLDAPKTVKVKWVTTDEITERIKELERELEGNDEHQRHDGDAAGVVPVRGTGVAQGAAAAS